MSPSAVSEMLARKRSITPDSVIRALERLPECLPGRERLESLLPGEVPALGELPLSPRFTQVERDQYEVIAEWHYFAILSLAVTKGFRDQPEWIAKRLGIAVDRATEALARLERLGMLVRNRRGRLIATGKEFHTSDGLSSSAIRRSHQGDLELARRSLEEDKMEERDFVAMTMAIDPSKIPEARRRIRSFRDRLCTFLESGHRREVYKLTIGLFGLSGRG